MTAQICADADPVADLLAAIRGCRLCADRLPQPPKPILQLGARARLAIVGQAPGVRAHDAGQPFRDPSGVRLRSWLRIDEAQFYDSDLLAIAPAGFCFPGLTAKGADRPPLKACAPAWQARVFAALPQLRLVVLAGAYGQAVWLGAARKSTLTETVRAWREYGPRFVPLPHPSWRNNAWLKRNPWFETECLPDLRARVAAALGA